MDGIELADTHASDVTDSVLLMEDTDAESLLQIPASFSGELQEDDDNMKIQSVAFYTRDTAGQCQALVADVLTADSVLIVGCDGSRTVTPYVKASTNLPAHFSFRLVTFWRRQDGSFRPAVYEEAQTYSCLHALADRGLAEEEVRRRRLLFGPNRVDVPVKSSVRLLVDEVLNPFYIFQLWSCTVWMMDDYELYASVILAISFTSAMLSLITTRRTLLKLREMARVECQVHVRRIDSASSPVSSALVQLASSELVPGDVLLVAKNQVLPCDAIVCCGSAVVDEGMLTGESLPVVKSAIPSTPFGGCFSPSSDARCMLFCGTKALEVRGDEHTPCVAIVTRTAFLTAKGRLVRSILFPRSVDLHFHRDSLRFVGILACVAALGTILSVPPLMQYGLSAKDLFFHACDIVTIAVPAFLPACILVGVEYALDRLRKAEVFCIAPSRVNIAGQLDTICFDKTGTLTEEGVGVVGVIPSTASMPFSPVAERDTKDGGSDTKDGGSDTNDGGSGTKDEGSGIARDAHAVLDSDAGASMRSRRETTEIQLAANAGGAVLLCLAACHDLSSLGGELVGDPLDIVMLEASRCHLRECAVPDVKGGSTARPLIASSSSSRNGGVGPAPGDGERSGCDGAGARAGHVTWEGVLASRFPFSSDTKRCTVVVAMRGSAERRLGVDGDGADASLAGMEGEGGGGGVGQSSAAERQDREEGEGEDSQAEGATRGSQPEYDGLLSVHVVTKGAPEVVVSMCDSDSVPPRLWRRLRLHAARGMRILALAHRRVPAQMHMQQALTIGRSEAEAGLRFVGLLLLENPLKAASADSILELRRAQIQCNMVTGDHWQTAVHVADRCGILVPSRTLLVADIEQAASGDVVDKDQSGQRVVGAAGNRSEQGGGGGDGEASEQVQKTTATCRAEGDRLVFSAYRDEEDDGAPTDRPRADAECEERTAARQQNRVRCLEEVVEEVDEIDGDGWDWNPRDIELALTGAAFSHLMALLDTLANSDDVSTAAQTQPAKKSSQGWQAAAQETISRGSVLRLLRKVRVYARMNPAQKQKLVEVLREELGLVVAFCGDGANDCGALKASHVGLSLSQAEASIAAPFTSPVGNISPMVRLVREGRCALVTSISSFKFMASYSMVQFISVLRLYSVNASLTDQQFLWIDLGIVVSLAVAMASTPPAHSLSPLRPLSRLMSPHIFFSLGGHVCITITVQALAVVLLFSSAAFGDCNASAPCPSLEANHSASALHSAVCEPPFEPCCFEVPLGCAARPVLQEDTANMQSVEVSAAFLVSQFQYLIAAIACNARTPFRLPSHTHLPYVFTLAILLTVAVSLCFTPSRSELSGSGFTEWAAARLGLLGMPSLGIAWRLLLLAVGSMGLSVVFERAIQRVWMRGADGRSALWHALSAGITLAVLAAHCAWAGVLIAVG